MSLNEAAIELAKSVLERNGYTVTPPKPPEVKYRPAEWPRDWNRADTECRDGESDRWEVERLIGFDSQDPEQSWSCASSAWYRECRVPILPGDEYREPILPQDAGKECEFSDDDAETWHTGPICAYRNNRGYGAGDSLEGVRIEYYKHARIRR